MCSREMKDSGIEWIGYVPNEWYLEKLKNLYSFEKGKNAALYTQEYIGTHKGEYPVYSGQTENDGIMGNIDTYDYEENECLFTTTVGAKVMTPRVIKGKFSLSQNCLIMKSNNNSSIKFIYYMLNPLFNYEKSLIPAYMQPSLRVSDLRRYQFYVPNIEEQQQIVNYLDKKVSQIDDIISKQKSLIEKYKAYKQSLITETVTKGLNKNVPMKDSGIEWNREIPVHWNVIQSKNLFSQRKDRAKEGERQLTASQKYGVIYQDEYMKLENQKVVTVDKGADILKQVEPNDFVISMRSFQGGLEYSSLSGSISSAYVMLIPNKKVYPPYFRWLFKSIKYINALQSTSNLVRDGQAMRYSNFKQIPLFEIPIEEQQEIAEFLDNRCKSIDSVISKKEQLIEKLESYKKSLIYECVTGKRVVN